MSSPDWFRVLERLIPVEDGESPVRMRVGTIQSINFNGTANVEISGAVVPSVAMLDGSTAGVSDVVHVLAWAGDALVLGKVAT